MLLSSFFPQDNRGEQSFKFELVCSKELVLQMHLTTFLSGWLHSEKPNMSCMVQKLSVTADTSMAWQKWYDNISKRALLAPAVR